MNQRDIFAILEIEPTDDKQAIKKAYAKLVKKYHPEEYPEEWKEIHEAYEVALALAERRGQDYLTFSVTDNVQMEEPAVKDPRPVLKNEKTEIPLKSPEESDELDALFDNINTLSKEQQEQDKEAFEKELQEVLRSFEKITDKKKLDRKEWEDFFSKKARMPYICNRDFLKMLGECFSDRKIDAGMYQFLLAQLEVIKTYCTDRNIMLQTISALDPVKYAEIKISGAYSRGRTVRSRNGQNTTYNEAKKTVWVILIIVGIIVRYIGRHAGHPREMPEIQKIPDEVIERTIENTIGSAIVDGTVEDNSDITVEDDSDIVVADDSESTAEDNRKTTCVIRNHVPMIPDTIQLGDSREVMIEAFGEPDEIRESQENPDYEEAVYWLMEDVIKTVIVLENDIVVDIYAESEAQ